MLQSLRGKQTAALGRRTATCPPPRPGPATSPTNLTCVAVDQAALYGLLRKARDLGLPLISGTPTLNTMERPLSTDTKSTTALHDPPVPVRAKLAAAWTSFMFLVIYVDYFALYNPSLMILLSMTLPARVNRAANLVVASLNIPLMIFNAAGESWTYFSFYGLSIGLELLLLAFILRSAWTWPRTAPSATMATMATSPDREAVRAQQQA